jgi:hypothetical protein
LLHGLMHVPADLKARMCCDLRVLCMFGRWEMGRVETKEGLSLLRAATLS